MGLFNKNSSGKIKILIVEDEEAINNMYQMKLRQEGYDVYSALTATEGLKLAESKKPALILLDLMMPEVSGTEFLEKLRSIEWANSIKVIILTNLGKSEASPAIDSLGVDRYIVKSDMTPSQVAQVVREVLGLK